MNKGKYRQRAAGRDQIPYSPRTPIVIKNPLEVKATSFKVALPGEVVKVMH
jgi:hypothetical protein